MPDQRQAPTSGMAPGMLHLAFVASAALSPDGRARLEETYMRAHFIRRG